MKKRIKKRSLIVFTLLFIGWQTAISGVRLKDIAAFQLDNDLQLIGYGLVVGLDGTGDSKSTIFTLQTLTNMMERMGITLSPDKVKVKNVAAVMVTAQLPSSARLGSKIDCTVSSLGDAGSLQGGMLLITQLSGTDGAVYATAQGPISIGGFNAQTTGGDKITENYALVGRIPGGAIIEKERPVDANPEFLSLNLFNPDFTTCRRAADKINAVIEPGAAVARNEGSLTVRIPSAFRIPGGLVNLISRMESLEVIPDAVARVVINEKTGTIVAGEYVTLSAVALAHGNLKIEIKAEPQVSQPEPFSRGRTVLTRDSEIVAEAEEARIIKFEEKANIGDLAEALNEIGATPRDIIAIFQALKLAGALRAELVIM
ncbi:MAG: flagellar basal body P-ring protein FlgI [Candidatus Zixiibacteriota bacterium]|nr:MAG: flagellar basal body P-ring protein FlgI [candidate division Zixibacteria bacterium]